MVRNNKSFGETTPPPPPTPACEMEYPITGASLPDPKQLFLIGSRLLVTCEETPGTPASSGGLDGNGRQLYRDVTFTVTCDFDPLNPPEDALDCTPGNPSTMVLGTARVRYEVDPGYTPLDTRPLGSPRSSRGRSGGDRRRPNEPNGSQTPTLPIPRLGKLAATGTWPPIHTPETPSGPIPRGDHPMLTIRHARAHEDWNDKNLGEKGFTLVELLVVIIILGVLAAVVVIAVNGFQDRGKTNACKTEERTIEAAAAAFYAANNDTWPTADSQLTGSTPPLVKTPRFVWAIDGTGEATPAVRTTPASGAIPRELRRLAQHQLI